MATCTVANAVVVTNNESGSTNEVGLDEDQAPLQHLVYPEGSAISFGAYTAPGQDSQPGGVPSGPETTELQGTQHLDLPHVFDGESGIEHQNEYSSPAGGAVHPTQAPSLLTMSPHIDVQSAVGQCSHPPVVTPGVLTSGSFDPEVFGEQVFVGPNGCSCWNCYEGELLLSYWDYQMLLDKARQFKSLEQDYRQVREQLFYVEGLLEERNEEIERLGQASDLKRRFADLSTKYQLECTDHDNLKKVHDGLREEFKNLEIQLAASRKDLLLVADSVDSQVDALFREYKSHLDETHNSAMLESSRMVQSLQDQLLMSRQKVQMLQDRVSQYELLINDLDKQQVKSGATPGSNPTPHGARARSRSPDAFYSETAKRRHELRKILDPDDKDSKPREERAPRGVATDPGKAPPDSSLPAGSGGPKYFRMSEGDEAQPPPAPFPGTQEQRAEARQARSATLFGTARNLASWYEGRTDGPANDVPNRCAGRCTKCEGPSLIDPTRKRRCDLNDGHPGWCDCGLHKLEFKGLKESTPGNGATQGDATSSAAAAPPSQGISKPRAQAATKDDEIRITTQCPSCYQVFKRTEPGGRCHFCWEQRGANIGVIRIEYAASHSTRGYLPPKGEPPLTVVSPAGRINSQYKAPTLDRQAVLLGLPHRALGERHISHRGDHLPYDASGYSTGRPAQGQTQQNQSAHNAAQGANASQGTDAHSRAGPQGHGPSGPPTSGGPPDPGGNGGNDGSYPLCRLMCYNYQSCGNQCGLHLGHKGAHRCTNCPVLNLSGNGGQQPPGGSPPPAPGGATGGGANATSSAAPPSGEPPQQQQQPQQNNARPTSGCRQNAGNPPDAPGPPGGPSGGGGGPNGGGGDGNGNNPNFVPTCGRGCSWLGCGFRCMQPRDHVTACNCGHHDIPIIPGVAAVAPNGTDPVTMGVNDPATLRSNAAAKCFDIELKFNGSLRPPNANNIVPFRQWIKNHVSNCFPTDTEWAYKEVARAETANSIDELAGPCKYPQFECKLNMAVRKMIDHAGPEDQKLVIAVRRLTDEYERFRNSRLNSLQLLWLVYDNCKHRIRGETLFNLTDLMQVKLGTSHPESCSIEKLRDFLYRWDQTLSLITTTIEADTQFTLFHTQVKDIGLIKHDMINFRRLPEHEKTFERLYGYCLLVIEEHDAAANQRRLHAGNNVTGSSRHASPGVPTENQTENGAPAAPGQVRRRSSSKGRSGRSTSRGRSKRRSFSARVRTKSSLSRNYRSRSAGGRKLCTEYALKGKCKFSDKNGKCGFSHHPRRRSRPASRSKRVPSRGSWKNWRTPSPTTGARWSAAAGVCYYWDQGKPCPYGDKCKFEHKKAAKPGGSPAAPAAPAKGEDPGSTGATGTPEKAKETAQQPRADSPHPGDKSINEDY